MDIRNYTGERLQNGFAEHLMRTIREEEIDLSEYRDFADAYGQWGRFLDDVYNRKRIHSSLGCLIPAESSGNGSGGGEPWPCHEQGPEPTASGVRPFSGARFSQEDAGAEMTGDDSISPRRAMLRSM